MKMIILIIDPPLPSPHCLQSQVIPPTLGYLLTQDRKLEKQCALKTWEHSMHHKLPAGLLSPSVHRWIVYFVSFFFSFFVWLVTHPPPPPYFVSRRRYLTYPTPQSVTKFEGPDEHTIPRLVNFVKISNHPSTNDDCLLLSSSFFVFLSSFRFSSFSHPRLLIVVL